MKAEDLKQHIYENNKLEEVLEELGMHHIKWHDVDRYITCGMPDGDNPCSTTIYNDSYLKVVAYTRIIIDKNGISDIISLVQFIKKCDFIEAMFWLGGLVGFSGEYHINSQDTSKSLVRKLRQLYNEYREQDDIPLQRLDEEILKQFLSLQTDTFIDENIDYFTQKEFEIGLYLDVDSNDSSYVRYSIPIRDELGTLVGVKGIKMTNTEHNEKIVDDIIEKEMSKNIYPYPESKILYGFYKTKDYIKEKNEVIICESEKGVMQLWSYGYKNAVGIGGHQLSNSQAEKIIRLGTTVVIAFDKNVEKDVLYIECMLLSGFCENVYYIYDDDGILEEKERPMNNPEKWEKLYCNRKKYSKNAELKNLCNITY